MRARTVLIVEDHTMIAEYIASLLARSGFEPIQARSLAEARRALAERTFDLWLCDRNLPDGDSSTLLGERDLSERHRGTPAIALTAELDTGIRRDLLAAGFDAALAKPCTPDTLRTAIDRAMGGMPPPASDPAIGGDDRDERTRPVLDDAAALPVCGGDPATLAAMRRLFASELPAVRQRLHTLRLNGDAQALHDELHRLAASTAWCGAVDVGDCARALRTTLDGGSPAEQAFDSLERALARLAAALIA